MQVIVELINAYHLGLSSENFEGIQICLDTLNELVQGPCAAN